MELDIFCDECNNENLCKCIYLLSLKVGVEIIMVLLNVGNGVVIIYLVYIYGYMF